MKKVNINAYEVFCKNACEKAGLMPEVALQTARLLVRTDMLGIYTHGTLNLYSYLKLVADDKIKASALPEVASEAATWAVVDGHWGIGMYNGWFGLQKGIELARKSGMSYVGIRNSSHYGACGIYAVEAAEAGMLAIVMSNTTKNMSVPGGKGRVIGNSPFAFSTPAGSHRPVFVDIATSNVAGMKVTNAAEEGKQIPEGWIYDAEGNPSTDPATPGYSLVPLGAHKGYCLSFFIEIFTSILAGGMIFGPAQNQNVSHSLMLIDVGQIMELPDYVRRVQGAIEEIAGSPKMAPDGRIYLPGEMEWDRYEKAEREGLPLTDLIVNHSKQLADMTGLGNEFDKCFL
ncbi:MAG: Ldh family oxidoreductase [Oscillospiraceae bacterium]|nr:Ldh family oxidoreductase [Oscillospiraceae bacterium]